MLASNSVTGNLPAAIYTRQSRTDDSKKDKQKKDQHVETTLDTQAAACKKEANRTGFRIDADAVFSERYTGAEMWDRPVLSELRRRIKARDYSALFVYSTDRLARDPIHLALILEECQRVNCQLVFVSEPLEDSPEGELILYIKGYAAKIERLRIKDRMARGRNAIIAAGKLTCQGNPPYGFLFDTQNRVRVIDPAPAQIVRDIFRWTIEGMSAHAIAARLRTMGLPSPAEYHGKTFKHTAKPLWGVSAVSRILKDETYTGKTHVNKYKVGETRNKKSGRYFSERKDREDWKALPDGVTPAIITGETFDIARSEVAKHIRCADFTRNEKRPVLLRGLVFCSGCESPLYPMSESTHRPDEVNRRIYKCSYTRLKKGFGDLRGKNVCRAKRLYAEGLEEAVWNKVVTFFFDPSLVQQEVKHTMSAVPDTALESDLRAAQKRLEGARRLRSTYLGKFEEATAEGDEEMAGVFDQKYKTANSDVMALLAVCNDLESRLSAYKHAGKTAAAFARQVSTVLKGMKGEFTFDEKRAALQALNARVYAADGQPTRIRLTLGSFDDADNMQGSDDVRATDRKAVYRGAATKNANKSANAQAFNSHMVGSLASLHVSPAAEDRGHMYGNLTIEVLA